MSAKKQSSLLSFFTPKSSSTSTSISESTVYEKSETAVKRVNSIDEVSRSTGYVKRKKIILCSDDDGDDCDDENILSVRPPPSPPRNVSSSTMSVLSKVSTPKSGRSRPYKPSLTPLSTVAAESFIDSFRNEDDLNTSTASLDTLDRTIYQVDTRDGKPDDTKLSALESEKFIHESFSFLKAEFIRDAHGRRPDETDYDPTTLYVPSEFLKEQTPVGKFYELYHMDAVIAVECLSLTFMRGNYAHAGFPEAAYGKFADQLVSRGYKVARIEQTETPQQLEERNRKAGTGKDKVVRREVCRVTTNATRTYAVIDGCNTLGGETDNGEPQLLIEFVDLQVSGHESTYGVCFIDTSVGKFYIGEFRDDNYSSYLRTLIANFTPVQVLFERGHMSSQCKTVLNGMLNSVQKEGLISKKQFFSAEETLRILSDDKYLGVDLSTWPEVLRKMLDGDSIVAKPNRDSTLALSALGAVLYYLQRCLIDVDMISMRDFTLLGPLLQNSKVKDSSEWAWTNRQMILDGITLENLNLIPGNSRDVQTASLSLYSTLNKCRTPFGKRMLYQWICSPTCNMAVLKDRQDAVEFFMMSTNICLVEKISELLHKMPDLERLLQKIHTLGLKYRTESHPDGRAVLFEAVNYNKRKIKDLLSALAGFQACNDLIETYRRFRDNNKGCRLLDQCLCNDNEEDLRFHLNHFATLFNHSMAEKEGVIVPQKGQDVEYDSACQSVDKAAHALEIFRRQQEEKLRCKVTYFGSGKNRFQLEIPDTINPPRYYELKSRRKGFNRYTTEELEELIDELVKAETFKDLQREDATRRVFYDFDTRRDVWAGVLSRISQVDVILSLARYCLTCGLVLCRPEFVCDSSEPFLSIEEGYHPCLATNLPINDASTSSTYIANDSHLGGSNPPIVLLTGPNMGGKSTLMRQVAVLSVLAHMGSFVPARSMRLSPVDRIFTRIGASDRLVCGQSTFFIELQETQVILGNATKHSLVLIDELGRGTSTFDGMAIASAVLSYMSHQIQCRTFFSTHYHSLCKSAISNSNIALAHMACMVEDENETDPTKECVTFLYRLVDGACPKSYGFFAARLAGVRQEVVKNAYEASNRVFDSLSSKRIAIATIKEAACGGASATQLREMINEL
ncbi:MutS domain V protein [Dictyocaulus viviparus]|uniref:DNA mismatch repair protein n=1 Tax=Dictyocaulus viviparus TaxID=29172 RepID=A0A0D8XFC6_DICVI|nr:MutS domain V protein [Dictyocaulus viviparus]